MSVWIGRVSTTTNRPNLAPIHSVVDIGVSRNITTGSHAASRRRRRWFLQNIALGGGRADTPLRANIGKAGINGGMAVRCQTTTAPIDCDRSFGETKKANYRFPMYDVCIAVRHLSVICFLINSGIDGVTINDFIQFLWIDVNSNFTSCNNFYVYLSLFWLLRCFQPSVYLCLDRSTWNDLVDLWT